MFSSVFFVPATPGSELLKMLKKTENKYQISTSSRIKFVETSGRKYIDQLQIKDPWAKNCSPPQSCFVCSNTTKQTNCKVANVGYSIICQTCKVRGTHKSYEGETCRNAHLRGREHQRDIMLKNEKSAIYKTRPEVSEGGPAITKLSSGPVVQWSSGQVVQWSNGQVVK